MAKKPDFDEAAVHRYYSADCYNRAWDLIDKVDRSPEEAEQMIRLGMASMWHWSHREDVTITNYSIGYWQLSRIYALLGQLENARRYGFLCLEASQGEDIPAFVLGYAYEALARTEALAGDAGKKDEYLRLAYQAAERIDDRDDKDHFLADLDTIH
jgi:hypothetical protein